MALILTLPVATMTAGGITAREVVLSDRKDWAAFLARSENGTLFHDLDVLAYHPDGRYSFHHLVFYDDARLVALLTGALVKTDNTTEYRSCPGASFGGFVFDSKLRLSVVLEVVAALVTHGRRQRWRSIQMTLPPSVYCGRAGQLVSFALARHGFAPVDQQITFLMPIDVAQPNGFEALFRPAAANKVRGALRKGVTIEYGGAALLPSFRVLFDQTFARHATSPTHSSAELEWLTRHSGDRVRFAVAKLHGDAIAAICLFQVTDTVANTFYICVDYDRRQENGALVILAHLIEILGRSKVRWLDLGPSGNLQYLNEPVISFKEGMRPTYALREHWQLSLTATTNDVESGRV